MEGVFKYLFIGFWMLLLFFSLAFVFISYSENEKRAAKRSLLLVAFEFIILFFLLHLKLPDLFYYIGNVGILSILIVAFSSFNNSATAFETPRKRHDERDVIFSRNLLKDGTNRYFEYYKRKPELKRTDDLFRSKPGLLSPGAKFYNQTIFKETQNIFNEIDKLQPMVEKPPSNVSINNIEKDKLTNNIFKLISGSGAVSSGVTYLKNYHLYSHIGRGEGYGEKVNLNHKYAIVFTVEMDKEAMRFAPFAPTVLESARQYLNAAQIAIKTAEYIRKLGFEARAHIDANYRVICPLVAQDAGLGTIGRMGLLITPELGPRVRIGVVTTNAPINIDLPKKDNSIIGFCQICKKCAGNCPVRAIPSNKPEKIDGIKRWKINSELCFTFWCSVGTDCGKCMQVCPYSHPNNLLHNMVRYFTKKNSINRWMALQFDEFFYGRKVINNNPEL